MKHPALLASFAILAGLSSCSMERTAFADGSAIEWTRKNNVPVEQAQAQAPAVTAAAYEAKAVQHPSAIAELPAVAEASTVPVAREAAAMRPANRVLGAAVAAPAVEASSQTQVKAEDMAWKPVALRAAKKDGGKSQLIALLLCIFIGVIGIHRFYLGYTWQGVVQVLTLGGCGVWALVDLIRIITGDLQPKDGSYSETL